MVIGHVRYIYSPKQSIGISDNAAEMQFCIINCTRDEAGFNNTLALALAHLSSLRDDPKTHMGIAIYWQSVIRDFGRLSFPNYIYRFLRTMLCVLIKRCNETRDLSLKYIRSLSKNIYEEAISSVLMKRHRYMQILRKETPWNVTASSGVGVI